MNQAAIDPCLLCKRSSGELGGMQATLVDGTLGAGAQSFALAEEEKSKRFKVKPEKTGAKLKFAGSELKRCQDGSWIISQNDYSSRLQALDEKDWS